MHSVGGFFRCDYDRKAFFNQRVPLYPNQYQRWLIIAQKPSTTNASTIKKAAIQWFEMVGSRAGLLLGGVNANIRAVKVVSASEAPEVNTRVMKWVLQPLPQLKAGALSNSPARVLYITVEFWYSGSATDAPWPWLSRGFVIQCPEDVIGGLAAVLSPLKAPEPPTLLEELHRPIQEAAISLSEKAQPYLEQIKDLPRKLELAHGLKTLANVALWGGVGFIALKALSNERRKTS
jgi:hypothetical protein